MPTIRNIRAECMVTLLFFLALFASSSEAFVVQTTAVLTTTTKPQQLDRSNCLVAPSCQRPALELRMSPVDFEASFSTLVVADDSSWRQYVSLALIAGVLVDILLGSPLANALLKPLKGGDESQNDSTDTTDNRKKRAADSIEKSKERIDSERVAKAAIERAQNALELRRFLDEQKTDWDRMEEMKRKLDSEMQVLDADLQARQAELSKKQKDTSAE